MCRLGEDQAGVGSAARPMAIRRLSGHDVKRRANLSTRRRLNNHMPVACQRRAEEDSAFERPSSGVVKRAATLECRKSRGIEQEDVALSSLQVDLHGFVSAEGERAMDELAQADSFEARASFTDLTSSSGPDIVIERCSMSAPDTVSVISPARSPAAASMRDDRFRITPFAAAWKAASVRVLVRSLDFERGGMSRTVFTMASRCRATEEVAANEAIRCVFPRTIATKETTTRGFDHEAAVDVLTFNPRMADTVVGAGNQHRRDLLILEERESEQREIFAIPAPSAQRFAWRLPNVTTRSIGQVAKHPCAQMSAQPIGEAAREWRYRLIVRGRSEDRLDFVRSHQFLHSRKAAAVIGTNSEGRRLGKRGERPGHTLFLTQRDAICALDMSTNFDNLNATGGSP